MFNPHAIARELTGAGLTAGQANAITNAVRQVAEQHCDYATRTKPESLATKIDRAGLEARLTWRFVGAILEQPLAILGGILAMLRLL